MAQEQCECGKQFDTEEELLAHIVDCDDSSNTTVGYGQDEDEQSENGNGTDEQDENDPVVGSSVRPAGDSERDDSPQAGAGTGRDGAGTGPDLDDVDEETVVRTEEMRSTDQTSGSAAGRTAGDGEDESGQHISGFLDGGDSIHSKWFFFGVGGCGGNLIDAIILRTRTLEERETELRDAWKDSIRGLASVNSNTTDELYQTCYVQEYRDEDPANLLPNNSVGPPGEPGGGAVAFAGEKLANWVFDQEEEQDFAGNQWGAATDHRRISDAQGVIFLHSSVKGTGSGATPVIASELDDAVSTEYESLQTDLNVTLMDPTVTMYSISVLPRSGCGDLEKSNGLVGFAKLVNSMNAVIPMDNENLQSAQKAHPSLAVEIDGTEGYQLHNHRKANETLISFLETFTFASVTGGQDATIRGGGLDPADPIRPARQCYTGDETDNGEPAVVMAPSYGHYDLRDGKFDQSVLDNLITNTLTDGKLVDFEYQTSWGGTFVVEGPTDQDAQIKEVCEDHFDEMIKRPDYLNIGDGDGSESETLFPTRQQYLFRTDIDTVRLWALIYNPKMERLKGWYDWAESRHEGPEIWQQQLEGRWGQIEDVFSLLGRENRGSI